MPNRDVTNFQDIPNVGKATEGDFRLLGFTEPVEIIGCDPYKMHEDLCRMTNIIHDPCVIDVFISAVRYMEGGPPKKWWDFTSERKETLRNKT